ncbi:MAG: small multi-drug export protein, partial [Acidaminococcaceae bacterium]|nr:small multi-drug export protein [Acidaminococcaceae bacterium]
MVEAIALWLHGTLGGKFLLTLLISMIPVLELRGGVPAGVAMGLPIPLAFLAGLVGNMIPVPFIILFARQILRWLYEHIPALANLT